MRKAIEEAKKFVCTTKDRIVKDAKEFIQNVDWKKVAIGVAGTLAVAAVVVATGVFDYIGYVPYIGAPADAINAVLYATQKDWLSFGLCAVSASVEFASAYAILKNIDVPDIPNAKPKSDDLIFGSNTKSYQKLSNQMKSRGWTEELIKNTVDSPYTIRSSVNKATNNPATVYYTKQGSYVIVDDITNEIVQISDNINPSTWIPDSGIINPYKP